MKTRLLLLLLCACGGPVVSPPIMNTDPGKATTVCEPASGALVDGYEQSGWVFRATVMQLNAATEQKPPDFADQQHLWDLSKMIVVRIDTVFQAPDEAPLPVGSKDTIILKQQVDVAIGDQLDFFVQWFEAGNTWVFMENTRQPATLDADAMQTRVNELKQYAADEALVARLNSAVQIVRGSVVSLTEVTMTVSDELPDWWTGTIDVTETLKGDPVTTTVARFDGAMNYVGYTRPKLTTDMHDVLLAIQSDGTVIDPLDVQQGDGIARVKRLLASPPVPPCFPQ
jgi:hypothetical protein